MKKQCLFSRIILFTDADALPILVASIPRSLIKAVVVASIRPKAIVQVRQMVAQFEIPVLIQPRFGLQSYYLFLSKIKALSPDLFICFSYSMLLKQDLLDLVSGNAINVHASLLPKNRGPNPIQWAIIHGEKVTGVTLHYMDSELDHGDILAQHSVLIDMHDTWVDLKNKINKSTYEICDLYIPKFLSHKLAAEPQQHSVATTNYRLDIDFPKIDFTTMSNLDIFNLIRAQVKPLKGAFIEYGHDRIYFDEYIDLDKVADLREKYMQMERLYSDI